jgi:hypothetical protein
MVAMALERCELAAGHEKIRCADLRVAVKTRYSVTATSGFANSARFVEKGT